MIHSFINTYFVVTMAYSKSELVFINALLSIFCATALIFFGSLTNRIDPMKMMLYGAIGITLFLTPFFILIYAGSIVLFVAAELGMVLCIALFFAPSAAITAQLFPYAIRYRGVALGNCIGLAFSGSCPYICSTLIEHTGIQWSPVLYLILIGIFGIGAVYFAINKLAKFKTHEHDDISKDLTLVNN